MEGNAVVHDGRSVECGLLRHSLSGYRILRGERAEINGFARLNQLPPWNERTREVIVGSVTLLSRRLGSSVIVLA